MIFSWQEKISRFFTNYLLFPFVPIKILAEADFFCYVNRFVGSFQGCLTQNHPKNKQS